ncbi:hypothetical protein PR202_gb26844 [Eleusine coracana subsp. coracana]|uniref:Reverse transcriptase zinc-binding domain-containing protein n=1 Tax=Eleusine coracana subsp. coracana TaxID=191504 RepID=A0AAV5FSW6_ELECO|nr:hypothetical protein PR202_gb26844 [Eleusine coracana subsp. coracana]
MWNVLQETALTTVELQQTTDIFSWRWGTNGAFSSSSAYKAMFIGETSIPGAKEPWKTRAPNNCRFFFWTLLHGRCWTAARLQKHELQDSNLCALCSQECEHLDHLFMSCVYSREIWFKVMRRWSSPNMAPTSHDRLLRLVATCAQARCQEDAQVF